jgi:hypothetical protein
LKACQFHRRLSHSMYRRHHIIGGEGNLLDEGIVRYLRMAEAQTYR